LRKQTIKRERRKEELPFERGKKKEENCKKGEGRNLISSKKRAMFSF